MRTPPAGLRYVLVVVLPLGGCGGTKPAPVDSASDTVATGTTVDSVPLPDPGHLDVVAAPDGPVVNRWKLTVVSGDPVTPTLSCTSTDDPLEHHRFQALAADNRHVFEVGGLLADTSYTCTATTATLVADAAFRTDPLPDDLPVLTPTGTPGHALAHGYVLFNTWAFGVARGQRLVVVDPQGRIRWYAEAADAQQVDVDVSFAGDAFLAAGGTTLPPTRFGMDGTITWQSAFHEPIGWHHDVRFAGDAILGLTHRDNTHGDATFRGFGLELRRPWSDEILWSWDSQQAIDAGTLPPGERDGQDAWHANAVSWVPDDPDGPAFWVNLKYENQIVRVDRATGDITWRLGADGDFTLVDPLGLGWFYGQHDPEVRLDGLVVYDNGVGRPGPDFSRVVGYDIDLAARTVTPTWSWTEPEWFEPLFGDADTLPDGHVLVDKGRCKDCNNPLGGEDRRWSLVELDPATERVVSRLDSASPDFGSYRADHIDGCALFANTRYCAEAE